ASLDESWTMARDGGTWDFVLRRGPRFHNGDPVTAEDVKFSFERYKGAAAPLLKDRVREVEVVDPGRVRFHLKEPWPDFMTFYGTSASGAAWIVPKKYIEKVGEDGFRRAPVGAGPYRFVSFSAGVELVLDAIDRQAINEAESLGFSGPTGNIVPRHQEFALAIDPHPYDPKRAKALLAEAGYPNGFDGGELTPYPPYSGMGEAIANYLVAVGI